METEGLAGQLSDHIVNQAAHLDELRGQIAQMEREISRSQAVFADTLRLYRTITKHDHPIARDWPGVSVAAGGKGPRLNLVVEILETAGRPMTLDEIVAAMPDSPRRGTVSAAAHRAVSKGLVARTQRGVYQLVRAAS